MPPENLKILQTKTVAVVMRVSLRFQSVVYLYLIGLIALAELLPAAYVLEGVLLFLFFMVFSGTIFYILLMLATRRSYPSEVSDDEPSPLDPLVYVLVPAHNEENVIGKTARSVLNQDYLNLKLFLINDNSTDGTRKIMEAIKRQNPKRVVVIDVPPDRGRKKPRALNYALELIEKEHEKPEFVFILDADYILPPDAIRKLVRIMEKAPNYVIGIQGNVRPRNWRKNFITKFITLERLAGFNVAIEGDMKLNENGKYGGTVALIRFKDLIRVGKFGEDAITEDTELWARALISGYRFWYYHGIVGWEEAVEDLRHYIKQRSRWAQGHLQVMIDYYWNVLRGCTTPVEAFVEHFYLLSYLVPVFWLLSLLLNGYLLLTGARSFGLIPPKISIAMSIVAFLVFWASIAYSNWIEGKRTGLQIEWSFIAAYPLYFSLFVFMAVIYTTRALLRLIAGKFHWEKTKRFT
ncbi:glycosyltransferase family 2 protein [Pyrococcus yayanosii]|uniref:Glycosyl transferase family protein n=1 Tax=Pyrococcus yayanosii (strain CH1 / JCM 16557) TaxID=529709 RepID=F8AFY8_PYRYC|nr:glycosyltransferase family 2 protein [Pyrococcus yayanosii]AEH25042.1 glycosyl transferase family protein [Pyrococcus yayanosii CH1]